MKPREWWIRINVTAHPAIFDCLPSHIVNQERPYKGDVVHVIEKTAFDALLAEAMKMRDCLEGIAISSIEVAIENTAKRAVMAFDQFNKGLEK